MLDISSCSYWYPQVYLTSESLLLPIRHRWIQFLVLLNVNVNSVKFASLALDANEVITVPSSELLKGTYDGAVLSLSDFASYYTLY